MPKAISLRVMRTFLRDRSNRIAGIVFQGDDAVFVLCVDNSKISLALDDGTPGTAAANLLVARIARKAWDALNV